MESIERMRVHLPPVDAGRLKYFAALIMLIDHVTCVFLERTYAGNSGWPLLYSVPNGKMIDSIGRAVGRQAFPIFCFFLVEGFFYTRSRLRYLGKLLVYAALSQVPFQKCIFPRAEVLHANVLCTLAIGLLAIWAVETLGGLLPGAADPADACGCFARTSRSVWKRFFTFPGRKGSSVTGTMAAEGAAGPGSLTAEKGAVEPGNIAAEEGAAVTGAAAAEGAGTWRMQMPTWIRWLAVRAVFLAGSAGAVYGLGRLAKYLHSDYSYGGVVLILILYLLRDYRISALFISWIWLSWYNKLELYAAPAFFLLACYNGKRGEQSKRFFYVFYPAHLTALWLLRLCIFRQ